VTNSEYWAEAARIGAQGRAELEKIAEKYRNPVGPLEAECARLVALRLQQFSPIPPPSAG
jgi:hypothetical protein